MNGDKGVHNSEPIVSAIIFSDIRVQYCIDTCSSSNQFTQDKFCLNKSQNMPIYTDSYYTYLVLYLGYYTHLILIHTFFPLLYAYYWLTISRSHDHISVVCTCARK